MALNKNASVNTIFKHIKRTNYRYITTLIDYYDFKRWQEKPLETLREEIKIRV